MTLRRGAGVGGADRITLVWNDAAAVENGWLQVTMKANATTGLDQPDVFYLGNLAGETADAGSPLRVGALDLAAVRRALNAPAAIASPFDFNRDGRVNALDLAAVRVNLFQSLNAITAPAANATSMLATSFNARRSGAYSLT